MKKILIFLLCLQLIGCGTTNNENKSVITDLDAANLKGRVSRVKESYHKVGDTCCPAGDKSDCSQKITKYNVNGYTIESAKVSVHGDTLNISRPVYDQNHVCLEINNFAGNKLVSREINEVTNGQVTAVKVVDNNGTLLNNYEFAYSNGLLKNGRTIGPEGNLLSRFENKYLDGRILTEKVTDRDGKVFSITRNKYNDHGDVIKSTVTHPRDTSEYSLFFEYVYDNHGNWTKQTKIYNDDIISIKIREIEYYADDVVTL